MVAPNDFKKRIVAEMETSLEELDGFCRARGVDAMAAHRFVRQLTEGLDTRESIALVRRLIEGGAAAGSNGQDGSDRRRSAVEAVASTSDPIKVALEGLEAKRDQIAAELATMDDRKAALKAQLKELEQATKALGRVTGTGRVYHCKHEGCDFTSASPRGISAHNTKAHAA